jgi:hypothetical protein
MRKAFVSHLLQHVIKAGNAYGQASLWLTLGYRFRA